MTQPEALLALIDDYAEARHAGGCHTYNVKTNEARKQVAAELRRLHARVTELEAQAVSKPTRTVTYVCPVCAASLERQE